MGISFPLCNMKYLCVFANLISKGLKNIFETVFERKIILCNIKHILRKLKSLDTFPPNLAYSFRGFLSLISISCFLPAVTFCLSYVNQSNLPQV